MARAGNRVHFETGGCYVEHISTGKITPITEKNGMFEIGVWVPSAKKSPEVPGRCPDFAQRGNQCGSP